MAQSPCEGPELPLRVKRRAIDGVSSAKVGLGRQTMARPPRNKIRRSFTLGIEQAEHDPLLAEAFYSSGDYEIVSSRTDPRCFLVGRTGSGKSAILQQLELDKPAHVVRINPDNLSLPYITNLGVMQYLDSLQVRLDPFFRSLWKHVLLVEILRHRYQIDSPVVKQTILTSLKDKLSRDSAKRQALEYLDEYQDRFWCETDERVREIVTKFEERVKLEAHGQMTLPGVAGAGVSTSQDATEASEERQELVARFQRIVNDAQLARLNKMIDVLNDDILDSQNFTYVVVDDLDRDWVDERLMNDLIRCLFRAVQDLKYVTNLKVIVALRTNIFQELEFENRFGQEEKLRALTLQMSWNYRSLTEMLDERVSAAGTDLGVTSLKALLPGTNKTRGNALEYVLDRTLSRPRDAISYVNECLLESVGRASITWDGIHKAEHPYSDKRLLALRDEWKTTYPDIHRVLEVFRGGPGSMDRPGLTARLDDVALLLADPGFQGQVWLTRLCERIWDHAVDPEDWHLQYLPLLRMLYQIGLLGCSGTRSGRKTFYYVEPGYVERPGNLGPDSWFHIHLTFRVALEISS